MTCTTTVSFASWQCINTSTWVWLQALQISACLMQEAKMALSRITWLLLVAAACVQCDSDNGRQEDSQAVVKRSVQNGRMNRANRGHASASSDEVMGLNPKDMEPDVSYHFTYTFSL